MKMMSLGVLVLLILISVAFFTLLERKALGYIHIRYGPNRVGPIGLFQPLGDAMKLFFSESFTLYFGSSLMYWVMPSLGLLLMLLLWLVYPFWGGVVLLKFSLIYFFCLISMTVYYLMLSGWSGSSKFGILGSYRSSAQSVSYEVVLIFIILVLLIFSGGFYLESYMMIMNNLEFLMMFFALGILWLMILLAESMRAPFDFSEGESELVSGFNTEYSGGLFSLIFIGEYGFMLFFSVLTVYFFLSTSLFLYKVLGIAFFYIWVRGSFPRLRYDKLMLMTWKMILPLVLALFGLYLLIESSL